MTYLIKDNTYDVNIDTKQTNEGYAVFNLVKTTVDECIILTKSKEKSGISHSILNCFTFMNFC